MTFSSFRHALRGILSGIKAEKNFRVMIICFILVLAANIIFKVTSTEWLITLVCSGMVLATELLNSAIEKTVDLVTNDYHDLAKAAKDFSSGAALIVSAVSFAAALIIYLPYFINFVKGI